MAKLVTLTCPSCGAPLTMRENLEHCTCDYCGLQHVVRYEPGSRRPEVLQPERVQRVTTETERLQNEIARLEKRRKDAIHTLSTVYYQPVSLIFYMALSRRVSRSNMARHLTRLDDRQVNILKAYTQNKELLELLSGVKIDMIYKLYRKLNRLEIGE